MEITTDNNNNSSTGKTSVVRDFTKTEEFVVEKLKDIAQNKESLHSYVSTLETTLEKLSTLLNEILDEPVPSTMKFSYRRISNINQLVSSISKLKETLIKVRENIHSISGDEIKWVCDIIKLQQVLELQDNTNNNIDNVDIKSLWYEVSRFSTNTNSSNSNSSSVTNKN